MLESLSSKLSKYLSPQLYKSIFSGEQNVEIASQAQEADDLLLRHRGLHRDHRPAGIGGADRSSQSLPARDVGDRARARRDHRQVHRRRDAAVLRRPGNQGRAGGREGLRDDGDRDAAAACANCKQEWRERGLRRRRSAPDRHQHRLLHRRQLRQPTIAWTTRSSATR